MIKALRLGVIIVYCDIYYQQVMHYDRLGVEYKTIQLNPIIVLNPNCLNIY
jgi:hypothetical protein